MLLHVIVLAVFAQNYTRIVCPYRSGTGAKFSGYYDFYGNPLFVLCQNSQGTGVVLVPNSSNGPSFQGSRLVTLYSKSGGTKYAAGNFYEIKMQVVCNGIYLSVSNSDSGNWNYMVVFKNGQKWYFD